MKALNNLSLKIKLPLMFMALTLLAMVLSSTLSVRHARQMSIEQAQDHLLSTRDARLAQLEASIERIDAEISAAATSPTVQQAIRGFVRAIELMKGNAGDQIRALYVDGNANASNRAALENAQDGSQYSMAHGFYHAFFRRMAQNTGYEDILLISEAGDVVYSVHKNDDYGRNIDSLGGMLRSAFDSQKDQQKSAGATMVDLGRYQHDGNNITGLIAHNVFDKRNNFIGVVVFRLPLDRWNDLLIQDVGLGETGDVFLVGQDRLLRTNKRNAQTDTALSLTADTQTVRAALNVQSGLALERDHREEMTFKAYGPLELWGQTWALISAVDESEVLGPSYDLQMSLIWQVIGAQVAILVLGQFMAHGITKPLSQTASNMSAIARGELDGVKAARARRDEIGSIDQTLGDMVTALRAGEQTAKQAALRGAALAQSSVSLMMLDEHGQVTFINPALEQLLQDLTFDQTELLGKKLCPFLGDDMSMTTLTAAKQSWRTKGQTIELTTGQVFDADDCLQGFVVEWHDVTQQQRNQTLISAIERRQILIKLQANGCVEDLNTLGEDLLGAVTGQSFDDFSSDKGLTFQDAEQEIGVSGVATGDFYLTDNSGNEHILQGSMSPVYDAEQRISGIVFLANDVTHDRKALLEAGAKQERMTQAQIRVVDELRAAMKKLSEGVLSVSLADPFDPEYEQLRSDFNHTCSTLSDAIYSVRSNADSIRGEVADISSAATDLSHRTEKQAATLEKTAAALEELTVSVQSAAEGAAQADNVVSTAKTNAEKSGKVVEQAVNAMGEIATSSQKISRITTVIDDIAFQTNLLALNAGVEAARAGEAGRGFAVVASEVRALAQRSSDAAKEINQLIAASASHVNDGVNLVGEAGSALKEIVASVLDISTHVSAIALSAKEQSVGLSEINGSMSQLDQVTQQNAAMFEETTAASQALNREAETLIASIAMFQTSATEQGAMRDTHVLAVNAVEDAADDFIDFETVDDWEDF